MRSVHVLALLVPLLVLSACATAPSRINDVCAVFEQNDGFFNDWHKAAKRSEAKHGIPVHILMATVRKESGFKHNARPPRKYFLGFIPWGHVSSAYGFSQALDATWAQYQRETGNLMARRTKFADAIDFVGWYHEKSVDALGISRNDASALYLAYYFGWKGYATGQWRSKPGIQNYARDTAKMAANYEAQMQSCGR